MIRGVHHFALHTQDIDRMATFYRDVLGFKPVTPVFPWADEPMIDRAIGVPGSAARSLMMSAGNCYIELFEYQRPPSATEAPLRPNDRGYTHFALDVDDIAQAYERLTAAGMRFVNPCPVDFGEIKAVYGYDPDGNMIELQQVSPDHAFAFEKLGRNPS